MILAVLASAPLLVAPKIVELPIKDSNVVVMQAWFPTANADGVELAGLRVLGDVMLRGTAQFTELQFADYANQTNIQPSSLCGNGWLRIQIATPRGGLTLAASLMESVLSAPTLEAEVIKQEVARWAAKERSLWEIALDPNRLAYDLLKPGDIRSLHNKFIRPAGVVFAIGGGIRRGEATSAIEMLLQSWKPKPLAARMPMPMAPVETKTKFSAQVFQLLATPIMAPNRASYAKLLAVTALGVGKTSAMFQVLRNELSLTYLQRAVLIPGSDGYTPRLIFATTTALPKDAIEILNRNVNSWSEIQLESAKALMKASLDGVNPVSPFWFSTKQPLSQDIGSQLCFDAFATLIGSEGLTKRAMLAGIEQIELEDLRSAARTILKEGKFVQILKSASAEL